MPPGAEKGKIIALRLTLPGGNSSNNLSIINGKSLVEIPKEIAFHLGIQKSGGV
jgi:hypothetical protein